MQLAVASFLDTLLHAVIITTLCAVLHYYRRVGEGWGIKVGV